MKKGIITVAMVAIAMMAGGASASAKKNDITTACNACATEVCTDASACAKEKCDRTDKRCEMKKDRCCKGDTVKCNGKKGHSKQKFGHKKNDKNPSLDCSKRNSGDSQIKKGQGENFAAALKGIDLSDAQKQQIREMRQNADTTKRLTRQERLAAFKQILTPEQYVTFLENLAGPQRGMKGMRR